MSVLALCSRQFEFVTVPTLIFYCMCICIHVYNISLYKSVSRYLLPTQDAQKAIPKGTLLAILITSITYLVMAWLSAIIVIRYAPGQPADFLGAIQIPINGSNDSDVFVNISFSEPSDPVCGDPAYNLTAAFPACDFSQCTGTNNTDCLLKVDCLYGDKSIESFYELCSAGFLALIGQERCDFGTLNNFQVQEVHYLIESMEKKFYFKNAGFPGKDRQLLHI